MEALYACSCLLTSSRSDINSKNITITNIRGQISTLSPTDNNYIVPTFFKRSLRS